MTGLLGAILVGGQGRRFGARKESARLSGGVSFETRVQRALLPVVDDLVRIGTDERLDQVEGIPDFRVGSGPLAGLETGLITARDRGAAGLVVLAVDLVRMTPPAVLGLLREWRALPDPVNSAVIAEAANGAQPLAGVYGSGLAGHLSGWLDREAAREMAGERPRLALRAWIDGLAGSGVQVGQVQASRLDSLAGHADSLLNVNHVDDLAAADAAFAPPIVAVQGWKNSGKTTVSAGLIRELTRRGLRVMALKRGHGFDLDTPGTDSSRMTGAGAERVLLSGPDSMALMGTWADGPEASLTALAARFLADADLVVAEGWKQELVPAIEVTLAGARDSTPLWRPDGPDRDRFLARVTDDSALVTGRPGSIAEGPRRLDANAGDLSVALADLVMTRLGMTAGRGVGT